MSGGWTIGNRGSHPSMKFWISADDFSKEGFDIFFNDIRHFGTIKFVKGEEELTKKLNSLGPDMLGAPPTEREFIYLIRKQGNKNICQVLMNQKVISGVGNYLKSESLYSAGISPWRTCDKLSDNNLRLLRIVIIETIQASLKAGGTTISTFKDINGHVGNFASQLQVYGNKRDRLGRIILRETTPDNRTSYWVPDVQL